MDARLWMVLLDGREIVSRSARRERAIQAAAADAGEDEERAERMSLWWVDREGELRPAC